MKLTRIQLDSLLGETSVDYRGTNLLAVCPWCKGNEFGISLNDNHLFGCFRKKACGITGNIFTLLSFLGRSREFIGERQINVFQKLSSTLQGVEDEIVLTDMLLPECAPPSLFKRSSTDEYLKSRGFADYQFNKFEVGRSRIYRDYVTILVRQEGNLIGYVGRSEKSKTEIDRINKTRKANGEREYLRYSNSHTDFAKTLFGLDEIVEGVTDTVILVEGIFSKTKTDLNLNLDSQEHIKCVATFGAKLSDHQLHWLIQKQVKNLIFWFEADVLKAIKPILARASLHFNVLASYLDGQDPNDIDSEKAFELLDNSENWLNFNLNYVQNNLKT